MLLWLNALGEEARATLAALQTRVNKASRAALGRRTGRIRLFPAVLLGLGAGLVVAFAAYGVLRWITPTSDVKAAPIDITRVALTVVAGVGGVVALVIAYRRQRDLEQSKFVERFGAAAAQLGATDVAVRIAGVYAMAGVADETDGSRRQQCIDVLCGYLRLPYSPDLGGNHQTKDIRKHPAAEPSGPENEQHFEYRQNDREVRKTIVRVIDEHLQRDAEYKWSSHNFDFRTAHFEDADFGNATFLGTAQFDNATFTGIACFDDTTFASDAYFRKATFAGDAWFNRATFVGDARFRGADFASDVEFYKALFISTAWFGHATIGGTASFVHAVFSSEAWFTDVTFTGRASFNTASFAGETQVSRTAFTGDARFDKATFTGNALFDRVAFGGRTSFRHVDFGSGSIVFLEPQQWGPPPPEFDWNERGEGKPPNVEPAEWPPVVAT